MVKELISVIIPIYNVEYYLGKCIKSVINQTYKNIEIILVDDGSLDNSGIICEKYKKIDNRIFVIHKPNGGLSSARNVGLDIAKGYYVCFIDSDDYVEANYLEELKSNMDKYNSDISVCDYYHVKNNNKIKSKNSFTKIDFVSTDKEKFDNIYNDYKYLSSQAWNKLYKKEIFDNLRYPNGKIFEDSYIICDILCKVKRVSYILKPLYNYVYRNNSIINSFSLKHFNRIDSSNKKISYFNQIGYYDLVLKEKDNKMNNIIVNLSKMKRYGINNDEIEIKYYQELLNTNKDVKWKNASKKVKLFKLFKKTIINVLSIMYKLKDTIRG